MIPLRVVAVASSPDCQKALTQQLKALPFVQCTEVVLELADAQRLWEAQKPDLLIIDLTDRELDACLFIEVINFNVENKTTVFGLHRNLDPNIILKAVSSGVKEFVHYPNEQAALNAAIEKYWHYHQKVMQSRIESGELVKRAQLIPVFSPKGGAGATTIAMNVAYELVATAQKSVVLVDMDQMFSNATAYLSFKPAYALGDLGNEKPHDIDDALLEKITVHHEETGIDVMVACKNILDENPLLSVDHLERVMTYLYSHYDYIVVDLPSHAVDEFHQYFAEKSDTVLLVSAMDLLSLYKTRQYLDLIQTHLDTSKFKLLVNRYDLKAVVGMSSKNLEEQFKYPIYHRLPNNWNLNVEAMSLGKPMSLIQPKSDLAKAFHELIVDMTGLDESEEGGTAKLINVGGLLGRFTGGKSHVSG